MQSQALAHLPEHAGCVSSPAACGMPMQADLAAKYQVVFQSYGKDLEVVQQQYEAHKGAPPLPRNSPPVAGNVSWARQLLRRIEGPMKT